MHPRKIAIKELTESGYVFIRYGANHDIWFNQNLGTIIPLKRHKFDESALRYIRQEIKAQKQAADNQN